MGTYLVMKNNLRRSLNHKTVFIITLLLPIVLCVIVGSIRTGKASIRIGLLEDRLSGLTKMEKQELSNILSQSEGVKYAYVKEDSLYTDLISGKYHVVLDYKNSGSIHDFDMISYANEDKRVAIEDLLRNAITQKENIKLSSLAKKGVTETEQSIALLMSLFMILSTITTTGIIRDKQTGTFMRYHFAKNSNRGYIFGYILYSFLIVLVQVVLCMVVLSVLQKNFVISIMDGVIIGVIIAAIATLFSTIICLGSKSEMQANLTASSVAAVMSLLGGTFVTIESMPQLLQIMSLVSPMRWINELSKII